MSGFYEVSLLNCVLGIRMLAFIGALCHKSLPFYPLAIERPYYLRVNDPGRTEGCKAQYFIDQEELLSGIIGLDRRSNKEAYDLTLATYVDLQVAERNICQLPLRLIRL